MPSSAQPASLPGGNPNNGKDGASTKSLPVVSDDDAPATDDAENYVEE